MAENESLDLGGHYAKRWDEVFQFVRRGASPDIVSAKIEEALRGGLRNSLKQLAKYGVTLSDLLASRNSPASLRQLIRKAQGHQYAVLFASAAAIAGGSESECIRGWVDAILDKVTDQISHRMAGSEDLPSFFDAQDFLGGIRKSTESEVGRIVNKLTQDPSWKPKRRSGKKRSPSNPTAELLPLSLLGGRRS